MGERFFLQSNFSGGQADSEFVGLKNSIYSGIGLDIHSLPGVVRVSQALTKESASVVVDFIKYEINASDGNSYFFGDTGKIYKRTSGGTWSVVLTDGNGEIMGASEFNGFIYWATATKLGRQSVTLAASQSPWTSEDNEFATLDTASFHPMVVQGLFLYIGNDRKLASVDDSATFTAAGTPDITWISLQPEYTIKTMINYGIDVLIGANITTNHSTARVFRWDTTSPTYITDDDIPENGINAFIPFDNIMYVQAGTSGHLYLYNGTTLEKVKKIRGDYSNKTMTVHPGSVCEFDGKPLFGVSNLSGAIGSTDTQFDITNISGDIYRYTYDGTGTNPSITSFIKVGTVVVTAAQNFSAGNNGTFIVIGVGTDYFEVTNTNGVAENNKTIGSGSIIVSATVEAVYSLYRYDRNYPLALMPEFVISPNKTSAIEIGALQARGNTLLVAWKDGSTYGVDKIDWSNKYASATLTTMNILGSPEQSKGFENYVIPYKQLPASTSIALTYDPNYSGSFSSITLINKSKYNKYIAKKAIEARTAKFKMAFTVNSNDAPEVEAFYTDWLEKEVL